MQPLRLGIITRRFWPHCGPTEAEIADIATAIASAGVPVEILTIRWEKSWPRSFHFREIPVTRFGRPIGGPWGMFRYLRRLNRHVKEAGINGLIVYGLSAESWAAIRNFAQRIPVVVKIDAPLMSASRKRSMNHRQLAILKNVKKILVDSPSTAEQLIKQYTLPGDLIRVVPPLVRLESDAQRSIIRQTSLRSGLSDAHPILQVNSTQPLVVCATSHYEDPGLLDLISAWPRVLDRFPAALLWILGDGLNASRIWERICDLGLASSIVMPGFFDDLDDVLLAADVYVHPLHADVCCRSMIRAMAVETCIVATDNSSLRKLIRKNVNGLLVPVMNPEAIAEAICLAIDRSDLRERLGYAAGQSVRSDFDVKLGVHQYLAPFSDERSTQVVAEATKASNF